jgi:hypothetical protein
VVVALVVSQSRVLREAVGKVKATVRRGVSALVRKFPALRKLRDAVRRLPGLKSLGALPEPMTVVPNSFSPFADVDSHALARALPSNDEEDEEEGADPTTSNADAGTDPATSTQEVS